MSRELRGHMKYKFAAFALLAFAFTANAQDEFHRFTFNVGGGYTTAVQNTTSHFDQGGNVQAGAGVNINRWLGVNGTFMFNGIGLTRSAITAAGVPDGNAKVYSFTVDPKIRFPFRNGTSFYILGGGGWMRRTVDFTEPAVASTYFFDPFFGYYPGYVSGSQTIGSVSQNAGAWDAGAGMNFTFPRTNWKMYIEARYLDGMTSSTHTKLVPITFGIRW